MAIENGQKNGNNTWMTMMVKAAAKKKKKLSRLVNELLGMYRIADDGQLQCNYRHDACI